MASTTLQARSLVPTLTVNDLNKSLKFYKDGLGFVVREEMKDEGKLMGVMLEAGEWSWDFHRMTSRKAATGSRAWECASTSRRIRRWERSRG